MSEQSHLSPFAINAFNWEDYYQLKYKVDYPLSLLIDDKCMKMYNQLFFFIVKVRWINDLLKMIWEFTNSSELRRSEKVIYNKVRRV